MHRGTGTEFFRILYSVELPIHAPAAAAVLCSTANDVTGYFPTNRCCFVVKGPKSTNINVCKAGPILTSTCRLYAVVNTQLLQNVLDFSGLITENQ
jgi:hypothetical protein